MDLGLKGKDFQRGVIGCGIKGSALGNFGLRALDLGFGNELRIQ